MKFLWPLLLMSLVAVSCSKSASQSDSKQLQELQQRISKLEQANRIADDQILSMAPNWVAIDPTSKNYQKISTSVLPLLVKSLDATQYLDGYKIKIALGNPYLVKFSGFTLTARWNKPKGPWENFGKPTFTPPPLSSKDKASPQTDKFGGVLVSTQHFDPTKPYEVVKSSSVQQYTDELSPGSWTTIELIITPATVEDLKNLRIAIDVDVLSLLGASK
jgi:hypothetical protein